MTKEAVRGQGTTSWLLCKPKYFDVLYEINPWMSVECRPAYVHAQNQWEQLRSHFETLNIPYNLIEPQDGLPDMVFSANGALVRDKKAVIASFKHPQRQGESKFFHEWFDKNGYKTFGMSGYFEGEGDALFAGDVLFGGHGFRTSAKTYEEIGKALDVTELVLCEMVDPRFYHLDTCFAPLSPSLALIYLPAFSSTTVKKIENTLELIPVSDAEAVHFACNAVVQDSKVILPSKCPETTDLLKQRGFEVIETDMSEFLKAGGAVKCCSLRI